MHDALEPAAGRPTGGAAASGRLAVHVNGEPRDVASGATVAALLAELGLAGRPVAVERNLEIVPRSAHAATLLAAGDRIEIVTMVGGG